jgi:hypothetical protein
MSCFHNAVLLATNALLNHFDVVACTTSSETPVQASGSWTSFLSR